MIPVYVTVFPFPASARLKRKASFRFHERSTVSKTLGQDRGLVGLQKGRGGAIGEGCARGTLLKGTLAGVGVWIGGKWNLKPTPGPSARPKALHGPRLPREGAAFQFTQRHGVGHLSAPERLSDPCPQPG